GTITQQVAQLLAEADELFAEADAALPDFARYAELIQQAKAKIAQAEDLLEAEAGGSTTTTTAPTTTTAAAAA
ncbi:MAG TPA: hypothetical protein VFK43_23660, partial [Acidimicrobiales bacterium]|nr:hypothetical protein [Acidimicrobiales bacterium]